MTNSILVVDDQRSQREILEMVLSDEGYQVVTAVSAETHLQEEVQTKIQKEVLM